MSQETSISRRTLCGSLVGLGAGLLAGKAVAAEPAESKPARPRIGRRARAPVALANSDFYGAYENTAAQARGEVVRPRIE